jgi:MFS family permease
MRSEDSDARAAIQQRTLRVLFATQVLAGIGAGISASVGALLAAELAGTRVSGFSQSAAVIGGALLAWPATRVVNRHGRRPSLAAGYFLAALGSAVVVFAAVRGSTSLLLAGFLLLGGAAAAGLQARFAAVDLAPAASRGRHLSMIIWATTLGAVTGPNLAAVAGSALDDYGVPILAAPFVVAAVLFVLAGMLLMLGLRPDPAILARQTSSSSAAGAPPRAQPGALAAFRRVQSLPSARLAVAAMAVGHLVMIGVMSMTPVHIRTAHDPAQALSLVGVVLSFHIAGMFALSPVIGWLTDRFGRRAVMLAGSTLLLAACVLAAAAGHDSTLLTIALTVLGVGWSCCMVAGSTLLTESVPMDFRTSAQGLSDTAMGIAGASAGALSGIIVHGWGYARLATIAALATAPFIVLVFSHRPASAKPASAGPAPRPD